MVRTVEYRGRLQVKGDAQPDIVVDLRLDNGSVHLVSSGKSLGIWPIADVTVSRLSAERFALQLGDEEALFLVDDVLGFSYEGVPRIQRENKRLRHKLRSALLGSAVRRRQNTHQLPNERERIPLDQGENAGLGMADYPQQNFSARQSLESAGMMSSTPPSLAELSAKQGLNNGSATQRAHGSATGLDAHSAPLVAQEESVRPEPDRTGDLEFSEQHVGQTISRDEADLEGLEASVDQFELSAERSPASDHTPVEENASELRAITARIDRRLGRVAGLHRMAARQRQPISTLATGEEGKKYVTEQGLTARVVRRISNPRDDVDPGRSEAIEDRVVD